MRWSRDAVYRYQNHPAPRPTPVLGTIAIRTNALQDAAQRRQPTPRVFVAGYSAGLLYRLAYQGEVVTLSPRTTAVLMLMIGFLAAWNTIIPALAIEWISAAGWRCGCAGSVGGRGD